MQNTSLQNNTSLPECILLDGGLGHEWKRQSGDESFLGGCLACARQPDGVSAVHAAFFDAASWAGAALPSDAVAAAARCVRAIRRCESGS